MLNKNRNQTGAIHIVGLLIMIIAAAVLLSPDKSKKTESAPISPSIHIPAQPNQAEVQFLEYCNNLAKNGKQSQACEDYFASKLLTQ